jgi:hypothetical protein
LKGNESCLIGFVSATNRTDGLFDVSMTVSASLQEPFPISTTHFEETAREQSNRNDLKFHRRNHPDIAVTLPFISNNQNVWL